MCNALSAVLCLLCLDAAAASFTGKVVGVSDGDTVTVLDGTKHKSASGSRASTLLRSARGSGRRRSVIGDRLK